MRSVTAQKIQQDRPRVVLSYGLGVDSTAVLLRWIAEPVTRPCDLSGLLVITAMTGDEWPVTGELVEEHVLPLLREHSIRYAQVARAGASQADGVAVLDDSRRPERVHLAGAYRLADEMRVAGTVPQTGGARLCSVKAKGWPLDRFIAAATGGEPYVQVIGFEAGEGRRAARDAACGTSARRPVYALIEGAGTGGLRALHHRADRRRVAEVGVHLLPVCAGEP